MNEDLRDTLSGMFFNMGMIVGALGRTDAMEAAKLAVQVDQRTLAYVTYLRDKLNALLPPTDNSTT